MAASSRLVSIAANRAARTVRGRVAIVSAGRVEEASATAEHGDALLGLGEVLRRYFHTPAGDDASLGGWWILAEVDVETASGIVVRPDLVGWRRGRVPQRPRGRPVRARPDWVCEVRPAGSREGVSKLAAFERDAVPHCWHVDPERGTLTAHHWTEGGYRVGLHADRWQLFRAEPFDAIEIRAGSLFGDDTDA
jgi:Putative restriction endonuclease